MRTFAKKVLVVVALLISATYVSNAQVVYWNGLGRALVTGSWLNGNALKSDPGVGQQKDTTSYRKSTDGYTIFDLGINAQPNEALRAAVILRLSNSFGGFYGDGSQFLFRQLRLDGVISKKVKYEIGDIDIGLSQYTLYNFSEIYNDYESDILRQRRSVVEYENFNFGNKWRMQGANVETNLRFTQGIEKIGLKFFATRNKRYTAATNPDRFMIGGRVDVMQSRNIQVGMNYVYLWDALRTINNPSLTPTNKNQVLTGDFKLSHFMDKIDLSVYGEVGMSNNAYSVNAMTDTIKTTDHFYDVGASVKYKPLLLKFWVNYRDVGANFFSTGAQTRRINDYGTPNMFSYLNNTVVEPVVMAPGTRQVTMLDYVSDQNLRNLNLQNSLMVYNPAYNNITPYGQATPNRKGFTIGGSIGNSEKLIKADVIADLLSESVSVGDTIGKELRKYTGVKGGLSLNLHKLLRYEKGIVLTLGGRYENTVRTGVNAISLKSTLVDAGLTVEVVKQLDLIGGVKYISAKGSESIYLRNIYNEITNPFISYNLDQNQTLISYGARYRFSKNTYFSVNGVRQVVKYTQQNNLNYNIDQVFFNYTMIF